MSRQIPFRLRHARTQFFSFKEPAQTIAVWQKVDSFKAAAEILNDPGLKEVFKTVIEKGCAIVAEPPVTG